MKTSGDVGYQDHPCPKAHGQANPIMPIGPPGPQSILQESALLEACGHEIIFFWTFTYVGEIFLFHFFFVYLDLLIYFPLSFFQ